MLSDRSRVIVALISLPSRHVLDAPRREFHVRLLQGHLDIAQPVQPDAVAVGEVADVGGAPAPHEDRPDCPGRPSRPSYPGSLLRLHRHTGLRREAAHQDGPLLGVGHLDPYGRPGAAREECGHRGVGEQPAPSDDDEVIRGQLHLAHQMAGEEDRAALRGLAPDELPHPAHAVRVEAVDRFVEDERRRIAEQRPRDPEPLVHAERVRAGPAPGRLGEAHRLQDLVDPAYRNAVAAGLRDQMGAGRTGRVHGLRVEQRADLAEGVPQGRVGPAVDERRAVRGVVEAEDHPHRGGLPGPVGTEEAGHPARRDVQGQFVDGGGPAVAFRQLSECDHTVDARSGGPGGAWGDRKDLPSFRQGCSALPES